MNGTSAGSLAAGRVGVAAGRVGAGAARIGLVGLLALATPLAGARPVNAQGIDVRRSVSADAWIEVSVQSHDVRITGWDRDEVHVTGDIEETAENFDVEGTGDRIEIVVEADDMHAAGRAGEGPRTLVIEVPRGASLEVESQTGDVTVEGVEGGIELETHTGDVAYRGSAQSVSAETFTGTVIVEGSATDVNAESVSGQVEIRAGGGSIDAESVSGGIRIAASGAVEDVSAETVSGSIDFQGSLGPQASVDLATHSGNITLTFPGVPDASFDLVTFSGAIRNAFGPEPERADPYTPGTELQFDSGRSGASVGAETFSGNVVLETQ